MKNYTDRAKAATLRQLLVIKYLNRVETVVDWPTFQISLRPNVYTLLRALSRSQDWPAGPRPDQSLYN